jgi:hypothetical protein
MLEGETEWKIGRGEDYQRCKGWRTKEFTMVKSGKNGAGGGINWDGKLVFVR